MSETVIGIVTVVVLGALWAGVGLSLARRVAKADDYLVGGRNVGVAFGAATLLATWVTGNTVLAAPESGYTMGLLGLIGYALTGGLGVLAFAPLARRIRLAMPTGRTVGDFFRLRFDRKNYYLFLIMLIIWDLGWLLTQGLGAGILLESVFNIPFHLGLLLTTLIVTIYVTAGGMISVLGTDFMQTLLILAVVFIFPAWVFTNAGLPDIYAGIARLKPDQLNLLLPAGILWCIAGPIVGIGEVFMDNTFWQRAFCLRPATVQRTYVYAGLGWMFVPIATGVLALVALGTGLQPESVNAVAPLVVRQYAGPVGAVLFLCLVWAAIASTLAALLNAMAAIFMNDIYQVHINPRATNVELLRAGKLATVVAAVLTVIVAWPKPLTMLTLLLLMGVINAAYVFPVTLGLFWSKTNRDGVFWGTLIGSLVGLFIFADGGFELIVTRWQITKLGWGGPFQGIIAAGVISMIITYVASWLKPEAYNFARFKKVGAEESSLTPAAGD